MRTTGQQRIHDRVIEKVAKVLADKYPPGWIHTNPGKLRRFEVAGHFPDLVLTDDTGTPHALYEVETSDSLVQSHVSAQWPAYSALGVPLYLVVPEHEEHRTKQLLRVLGIRVAKLVLY